MIKIKYHYTDDFRLKGFTLKGHAEYAESGYDIVFIARVAINDVQYNEVNKSMKHLVNKFKLFNR